MDKLTVLQNYKNFLSKNLSPVTLKNYISDLNHFIDWGNRELGIKFSDELFTKTTIDKYYSSFIPHQDSNPQTISFSSLKRHLSSIRSFTSYLESVGFLKTSPFTYSPKSEIPTPWKIDEFKIFLHRKSSSDLTIKYYVNDIQSFSKWCNEVSSNVPKPNQLPQITNELLGEYVDRLKNNLQLAPNSINRKLSSIRTYLEFLKQENQIQEVEVTSISNSTHPTLTLQELIVPAANASAYSKIPPIRFVQKLISPYFFLEEQLAKIISSELIKLNIGKFVVSSKKLRAVRIDEVIRGMNKHGIPKEFYAPHQISISSYPIQRKVFFHLKHTRPEWYKRYHTYPFVHYFHFATLVIFAVGASIFFYDQTLGRAKAQTGTAIQKSFNRTFVFKGTLHDRYNNPVTETSHVRLSLYDTPTSSGSALLWQEVQMVKPSEKGDVNMILGSTTEIPDAYLNGNMPLYLGITIENGPELSPRKQLGVAFADNSYSVQGYIPNTLSDRQSNVLLALDSTGNLSIGGQASPTFQATGGDFSLSGNTLILQTNASSNGNVVISPNGNGKIDLLRPLINSRSETSTVEVQGGLSVSASNSASPALLINQESGAPLITANTIGSTRFSVDSQGVITKGVWAGLPISTEFGGFGANISATGPGELLFSTSSNTYGHLTPGTAGECLTSAGRTTPLWSTCGFLAQLDGALTLTNNTVDVLFGDTSTSSAKFALTNMNTGTPTFKIGNTLSLDSNGSISSNDTDLTLGGNTTQNVVLLTSSGNVGVQQQNPTRSFDVQGNWGGNVDFYSDGATSQTVTRSTKALIYDLEKNTGSTDTSTTTTYNIVGLPDIDGTIAYIYTKVVKGATPSSQSQTIALQINGVQISTASTVPGILASTVIKHYTAVRSNNTWHLLGDSGNTDTADVAEWIQAVSPLPEPGSIVSFDTHGSVGISTITHDPKLAGVISTNPNIVIGPQTNSSVRLALNGRVPVMVSSIRGAILIGDAITSSSLPGFGMKPSRNSAVVGKAITPFNPQPNSCTEITSLEHIPWPADNGTNSQTPCFKIKASFLPEEIQNEISQKYGVTKTDYIYVGKVIALVNLSWSTSNDLLTSVEGVQITDDSSYSIDSDLVAQMDLINHIDPTITIGKETIQNVGVFSKLAAGKIKTGVLSANSILTKNLSAQTANIASLSAKTIHAAENITIQGKPLQQFIAESIENSISPFISVDTLSANLISPLSSKTVTFELPDATNSAVLIRNKKTQENVFQVDSHGNVAAQGMLNSRDASVSGQLTANTISSQNLMNSGDASISGTLRAASIIASDISGLEDKVATMAANIFSQIKPVQNFPSSSLENALANVSLTAKFGTFSEGLLSLGASTFGNLAVMDMLSVGTTLTISQNGINTLASDLEIQPLRQNGVSFLAGSVKIQKDGQLIVNEDAVFYKNVTVKGKLYVGIISPLPDGDVTIQLPSTSGHDSNLIIQNSSSSAVLSVNSRGDVNSSGSARFAGDIESRQGTFSKINLSLVGQAIASNENEAVATGSAGTAILKANTTELTILNPIVSEHSLIYVTPAQNTYNQVLFLMRQNTSVSFTVGVSQKISRDIEFNWLIVN